MADTLHDCTATRISAKILTHIPKRAADNATILVKTASFGLSSKILLPTSKGTCSLVMSGTRRAMKWRPTSCLATQRCRSWRYEKFTAVI